MPRTSQTELAVLGALSIESMTGYQLRTAIQQTLGHFWAESFGQIYPALARLEGAGQVRKRGPAGRGRTSGSLFELTPEGRAALREGLARPAEPVPPRDGLLLRLFFGDVLGPDACRELLAQTADRAQAALARYSVIRKEIEAEIAHSAAGSQDAGSPDAGRPYRLMTLAAGEHSARAALAWATECLATLPALSPAPTTLPALSPAPTILPDGVPDPRPVNGADPGSQCRAGW